MFMTKPLTVLYLTKSMISSDERLRV